MKNNLNFVKIGLACGAGVLSILATSSRLQAQNNPPAVKEVSLNKNFLSFQHLSQLNLEQEIIRLKHETARKTTSTMNRAQQAYFLENNRLTSNLNELEAGIKPNSDDYLYRIKMLSPTLIQNIAVPKRDNLKSYTGIVYIFIVNDFGINDFIPREIICESLQPSKATPPPPQRKQNEPECPVGFNKL